MLSGFPFAALDLDDGALTGYRRALYHSTGPGYVVFKGIVDAGLLAHLVRVWTEVPLGYFCVHPGKAALFRDVPNLITDYGDGFSRAFHCFIHNPPVDEATAYLVTLAHLLRNRLQGHHPLHELTQTDARMLSYRIVRSGHGHGTKEHSDFGPDAKKHEFDKIHQPERLQVTIHLSRWGRDYVAGGHELTLNDGSRVHFGRDVEVEPGDMVIWRYGNSHRVAPVTAATDLGFLRVLMPTEVLVPGNRWAKALHAGDVIYATERPVDGRRVAMRHA